MLAHKLVLEDVVSPFKLIAIHCSAEEYKLAFLLNKHLNLKLARTRWDHDCFYKDIQAFFPVYKYENQQQYCSYYLISNKFKQKSTIQAEAHSLFPEDTSNSLIYLLSDYKNVDYFLKIEEEFDAVPEKRLADSINEIPQITTAYSIANEHLKNKENLIFD